MNFRQRYQFDVKNDLIGKGGFSKVYRAWDSVRKRNVALKFFYGDWTEKYDVIGEINRMEDLIHPNLIRYYDATVISSISAIGEKEKIQVGILEFANDGDISKLFQTDNYIVLRRVITQLLEGLSYLHKQQIIHRDLKPKNVLLSKENGALVVKIADFGISKKVGADAGNSTQLLGSIEYMSPEQFNPKKYGINGDLATNVDLWSVGIIIYELFTRSTPFGNRSTGLTNEEILNNILFNPIEINYSKLQEPYKTMVKKCLEKNAFDRVETADELLKILNNPISEKVNNTQDLFKNDIDNSNETQILPNPKELIELAQNAKPTEILTQNISEPIKEVEPEVIELQPLIPINFETKKESTKIEIPVKNVPKEEPKIISYEKQNSFVDNSEIKEGKRHFKVKDYIKSYSYLKSYTFSDNLDTESKFYIGYMLYSGKCGGDYKPELGKKLMDEAKSEDRSLVTDLMVKYILND